MNKKKEAPEKIRVRVNKYLKTHSQLLITGLSQADKEAFINLKGLEGLSYSKKLSSLVSLWNNQDNLSNDLTVNINDDNKTTISNIDLEGIDKEFINFLYDFKATNKTTSGLRRNGQAIRNKLKSNLEYSKLFDDLCFRLSRKVSKFFREMFEQGYFNLKHDDISNILKESNNAIMTLLLLETINYMNKDNPFKEAKKALKKRIN